MSRKSKALESKKAPVAFGMDTVPPNRRFFFLNRLFRSGFPRKELHKWETILGVSLQDICQRAQVSFILLFSC